MRAISLYIEVRYARDTSLSMPKNSDIFRLLTDHRRRSGGETYALNLKLYLDNLSIADMTMDEQYIYLCNMSNILIMHVINNMTSPYQSTICL